MRKSWQWRKVWLRYGIVFLFVCMCIGAGAILYFDGGRNQNESGLEETEIRKIEEELPEMDSDRYTSDIKKVARISIQNNAITVVQSLGLFLKFYENCGRIMRAGMLADGGDKDSAEGLYFSLADVFIKRNDYQEAREILEQGQKSVGEDSFLQMYQMRANEYLLAGEYLSALQILMVGVENTEDTALAAREAYLRENIVRISTESYNEEGIMEDRVEYNTQGKVVKSIRYSKIDGSVFWHRDYEYDADGNETKMAEYADYIEEGESVGREEVEYDAEGRKIKYTSYSGSGDVIYYYTYEYNDEGLLWKQTFAAPGWESREEYWMEYEYDDMGNQTQEIQCSVNGNIISRGEWKYDASGQKTEELHYDREGNLNSRNEWEYDTKGNMTRSVWYYENGSIREGYEWKYDTAGNMTEERCFDDDGISARTEYAYDSRGNLTQEICYDQGGSIFEKYEYEYDEDGRKIKETDARGIDDAGTFEYDYHEWEYDYAGIERKERWSCSYMESWTEWKYDAMGNWTAMIEYHGAGSVESCTEQKYQYVYLGS